jgi:hypothetical protein
LGKKILLMHFSFAILPKLRAILKPAFFVFLILLSVMEFSSCKNDTECEAVVTVNDTAGLPLQGATIRLFAGEVEQFGTSDAAGQAEFTFEHPAILDIIATDTLFPGDTAKGILKLEEGEKVRKTVQF